jgi:DNA helicase-2/ATP-dependent DNA helicase PcrA
MILEDLNPQQQKAVLETEGPLLILAGAGSGKTRVLTYRIAYILKQKKAYPHEILAVTFTNKAAGEMKERVLKLTKKIKKDISIVNPKNFPYIGTFHSICVKLLRADGHVLGIDPHFTIYDQDDQLSAVKETMKELDINIKEFNPRTILTFISEAKNELILPDRYPQYVQGYVQEMVVKIYPLYQKKLRDNNACDFDDLIMQTVIMFQDYPEILKKYQHIFKYVLVDEYQDTNHIQYLLVNQLADKYKNICVVGDDDQAIYSWRGATIKNILSFEHDYPNATVVKLEQNYRSTKRILNAASSIIRHNQNRKVKELWTDNPQGNLITVYTASSEKDEAYSIAKRIEEISQSYSNLNDFAILYRTNAQSRVMEEALLNYGIPYIIFGNISFYQRKEIKDVIAFLRVLYNPKDDVSLKRIINVPPRKIGARTINKLEREAKEKKVSLIEHLLSIKNTKESSNGAVYKFANLLQQLFIDSKKETVKELIKLILEKTGYIKWIDDETEENLNRIENIKELLTVANKYDDLSPEASLAEFLNEVSLIEEQQIKAETKRDENRVRLMTLHQAKGLEFDYVFIIGMEEGLFPHSRSYTDPSEMEEERRLAYVGITRAKKHLFCSHAETRMFFGAKQDNLISRFLEDIPDSLTQFTSWEDTYPIQQENTNETSRKKYIPKIQLKKGDRVEHPDFGRGVVLEIDESIIKIDFGPIEGVKQLALEYAKLNKF